MSAPFLQYNKRLYLQCFAYNLEFYKVLVPVPFTTSKTESYV